jgi:Undecaprenyl-phosphate galactose phosphotransferase WbaP
MALDSFIRPKEGDLQVDRGQGVKAFFNANARLWMAGMLVLSDLFGVFAAMLIAILMRGLPALIADPAYHQVFFLLAVTLLVTFYRRGLYPAVGVNPVEELQGIVTSTTFAFFILIGITFLLKNSDVYSRVVFLLTWVLGMIFIPAGRFLIRRLLIGMRLWGEPVIIIGDPEKALPLAEYFTLNRQFGIRPVAVLHDDDAAAHDVQANTRLPVTDLKEYARALSLNTVLIAINDLNSFDRLVERYRFVFGRVILVKYQNGKFALNHLNSLDFSDVLGLQVKNNLLSFTSQAIKRVIDLLVSALGLVVLSPFLIFVALAIQINAPGRVFYRQKRLGRNGNEFVLLKFRTMHLNAERLLQSALEQDGALKQEWDRYQKLRNDPRITRVGGWLRKFSLDELPQLWNVMLGEMSLVGPRPIMPDQREKYGGTFNEYMQVTPGMTGLWQVSGRNETTFARRAELDDEYIQRWSLWLDVYILLKTLMVVFRRDGAF